MEVYQEVSGRAVQKQAMDPHQAAMSAIRSGQFKLTPVMEPAQPTTPAADAKDALMSAIKNRQYNLKPVSPAVVAKAGKYLHPALPCSPSFAPA